MLRLPFQRGLRALRLRPASHVIEHLMPFRSSYALAGLAAPAASPPSVKADTDAGSAPAPINSPAPATPEELHRLLERAISRAAAQGFVSRTGDTDAFQVALSMQALAPFSLPPVFVKNVRQWFSDMGLTSFVQFSQEATSSNARSALVRVRLKGSPYVDKPAITPRGRHAFLRLIQGAIADPAAASGEYILDEGDGKWVALDFIETCLRSSDKYKSALHLQLQGIRNVHYWLRDAEVRLLVEVKSLTRGRHRHFARLSSLGHSTLESQASQGPAGETAVEQEQAVEEVPPAEFVRRVTELIEGLPAYLVDDDGWVRLKNIDRIPVALAGNNDGYGNSISASFDHPEVAMAFEVKPTSNNLFVRVRRQQQQQGKEKASVAGAGRSVAGSSSVTQLSLSPSEFVSQLNAALDALPVEVKDDEGWVDVASMAEYFKPRVRGMDRFSKCLRHPEVREHVAYKQITLEGEGPGSRSYSYYVLRPTR